jgi:cytidine deaminase
MKPRLPAKVRRLVETALKARSRAYCPYSRFPVGASVLTSSGKIYSGSNVENASYGLSMCAERVAIFTAVSHGEVQLRAICIAAKAVRPCGACRQVMAEFLHPESEVYLADSSANLSMDGHGVARTSLKALLPQAFDPVASGLLPFHPKLGHKRSK